MTCIAAASHHLNAGAVWAESPRALAEQADVIFSSLPGQAEVEPSAWRRGPARRRQAGAAYFDLSTNSPAS